MAGPGVGIDPNDVKPAARARGSGPGSGPRPAPTAGTWVTHIPAMACRAGEVGTMAIDGLCGADLVVLSVVLGPSVGGVGLGSGRR